jgi:hypothetical protein
VNGTSVIASRSAPRIRSILAKSRSSPPPAHLLNTRGAGQPRFKSIPATGCFCNSFAVRTRFATSLPIICNTTGRPVSFDVAQRKISRSSFESAVTRKYSAKHTSAPPYRRSK